MLFCRIFYKILYTLFDLIFEIIGKLRQFPHPVTQTLLIIRPDNIGDYILFRNLLGFIRNSPQYQGFKITLLGNFAYKALAETLDKDFIDEFLWLDISEYRQRRVSGFLYTFSITWKLCNIQFHTIFYPVFSRVHHYDKLVGKLHGTNKIACLGDKANKRGKSDITERVYNRIIQTEPTNGIFEFERNKEIISKFLGEKIEQAKPNIETNLLPAATLILPKQYVVFHVDASSSESIWPQENFAQAAEYIYQKYSLPIVLLGYSNNVEPLMRLLSTNGIINLYNKTSLPESAAILSKADIFIGNDSGLLHIAAAVGVQKIICLCKGNTYGRFVPYPSFSSKEEYYFVFPPIIECKLEDEYALKVKYADGRYEDIKTIPLSRVLKLIDTIFQGHKVIK